MERPRINTIPRVMLSSGTEKSPSPKDLEASDALQEFDNPRQPPQGWAIFNTASILPPRAPKISGSIFLSRAVSTENIRKGGPDRNSLHVCTIDSSGNRQRLKDLKLPVDEKIINWEDARVGSDGTLGFTVVFREGDQYIPHPALVNVETEDGNLKVVGVPKIFGNITGKNVIPFGKGFLYRPNEISHELHYLDLQGKVLRIIDFSNFRHIEWLSKTMGAAARPIELKDGLQLLLIHGLREGKGIDGFKDVIYALGIAVLNKRWQVIAVDRKPLLERSDFLGNLPLDQDLRHEKEVVYLCDYIKTNNGLILLVNVGDRITVLTPISYSKLGARIKGLLLE